MLAEFMLPDGAHKQPRDWTVFFLNRPNQQNILGDSTRQEEKSSAASSSAPFAASTEHTQHHHERTKQKEQANTSKHNPQELCDAPQGGASTNLPHRPVDTGRVAAGGHHHAQRPAHRPHPHPQRHKRDPPHVCTPTTTISTSTNHTTKKAASSRQTPSAAAAAAK